MDFPTGLGDPLVWEVLLTGALSMLVREIRGNNIQALVEVLGIKSYNPSIVMLALILAMMGSCVIVIEVTRKLRRLRPRARDNSFAVVVTIVSCTLLFVLIRNILFIYVIVITEFPTTKSLNVVKMEELQNQAPL